MRTGNHQDAIPQALGDELGSILIDPAWEHLKSIGQNGGLHPYRRIDDVQDYPGRIYNSARTAWRSRFCRVGRVGAVGVSRTASEGLAAVVITRVRGLRAHAVGSGAGK